MTNNWIDLQEFVRFDKTGGWKKVRVVRNGDDVFLSVESGQKGEADKFSRIMIKLSHGELCELAYLFDKLAKETTKVE